MDDGMISEVLQSSFPQSKLLAPRPGLQEDYEPAEYAAEYNQPRFKNNAGMLAMQFAIERWRQSDDKKGRLSLICLGFDFLKASVDALDNVYEHTPNYGPETAATFEDSVRLTRYFNWFCRQNPDVDFIMGFADDKMPSKVHTLTANNVKGVSWSTIVNSLQQMSTAS